MPKTKPFKRANRFIRSDVARALLMAGHKDLLQVGQWIKNPDGKCSRIVRRDAEVGNVQLHPDHGEGTVCQRFLRAHALKVTGVMDLNEPQSVALACKHLGENDRGKLQATVAIMAHRLAELNRVADQRNYKGGRPRLVA